MEFLLKNIRYIIYSAAAVAVAFIYITIAQANPNAVDSRNILLTDYYALTALFLLYATLLIGPLYSAWPNLPLKELFFKARPALGVSAFVFSLFHAWNSFFYLLGGFAGLSFLPNVYIVGVVLGAIALVILAAMAVASAPFVSAKMGRWWKPLNRLVYFAGLVIIFHALLLGTHFINLSRTIPQIFFFALLFLLVLESLRIDKYFTQKFPQSFKFGSVFVISAVLLTAAYFVFLSPSHDGSAANPLGAHAQHILIAQQLAAQPNAAATEQRFTLDMIPPQGIIKPNVPITLKFIVYNAATSQQVKDFELLYTKLVHMVVVDNELDYFSHIHPELQPDGTFTITTTFPKNDLYHIYWNFEPKNSLEQQIGLSLQVGSPQTPVAPSQSPDTNLTKTFGNYNITLVKEDDFRAKDMTTGLQTVVFGLTDAKTKQPVTNLEPYLGAFGHLTMVNEKTFDYIHVHPQGLAADGQISGPSVQFVPLGLYGPIVPGVYRVFAEFNPGGHLLTADFTINIQ